MQDQCAAAGADYFFNTHLFGPKCRLCGGQVHKINTGDDEDKEGNDGKQPDIDDTATALDSVLIVVIQIPIGEPAEEELGVPAFTALLCQDIMSQLPVQGFKVHAWFKEYERVRIGVVPFLKSGASFQRQIKVEKQVGFFGGVWGVGLKNAPDLIVAGEIILIEVDDFPDKVVRRAGKSFGLMRQIKILPAYRQKGGSGPLPGWGS